MHCHKTFGISSLTFLQFSGKSQQRFEIRPRLFGLFFKSSVTRLGYFLKSLVTTLLKNVVQKYENFLV